MKQLWLSFTLLSCLSLTAQNMPYKDASISAQARAEDLLSRLTLDEKITLMMNQSDEIKRLDIPAYNWWNEALHGVGRAGLATVFPQPIGMAASFDDNAVYDVFNAVSDEARAKHHFETSGTASGHYQGLTFWTPNVNIFRDPRWGRGQETYGEDPFLTSRMGVAVVKGLQGDASYKYNKTHACAKHYAVHSGPEWNRHSFNAENVSTRDLWETYLPAFKSLVKEANVKEVMCAYNRFDGLPCCGSDKLLIHILRNEWKYQGIVVSDCGAVDDFFVKGRHETHTDGAQAASDAVISGTDLECGNAYRHLKEAVKQGAITEKQIDIAVCRLLKARFELGLMDSDTIVKWAQIPYSTVNSKEHKEMALNMARKSMVLLQNKDNLLPLPRKGIKIAVVGPNATDSIMQWGNYNGTPEHTVTILEGIQAKIGTVSYERGCELVAPETISIEKAVEADVVIFVGGISPQLEGEEMKVSLPGFKGGDRTDIELPKVQRNMLESLKAAGKKVIFVCCSGSAIALTPIIDKADAILQAWYPGQAGGTAVADVLFGDYNPSGRLPVTFYNSTNQLPDYENYSMKGRTYRYMTEKPLFPFGYGLSYTTFEYKKAKLKNNSINETDSTSLKIQLKNKGKRDGEEVVQIYIRNLQDPEGPQKSLRAFKRVFLKAGEKKTIEIALPRSAFSFFDPMTNHMRIKPGKYEIYYGGSSNCTETLTLTIKEALEDLKF